MRQEKFHRKKDAFFAIIHQNRGAACQFKLAKNIGQSAAGDLLPGEQEKLCAEPVNTGFTEGCTGEDSGGMLQKEGRMIRRGFQEKEGRFAAEFLCDSGRERFHEMRVRLFG